VINLSLCFTFPIDQLIAAFPIFGDSDFLNWVLQVLLTPLQILQGQEVPKEAMDEELGKVKSSVNGIVVAAAGNKGTKNGGAAPKALYPAAFNSVLGVGALDLNGNRAWYSNEADAPPVAGIVTTGGSAEVETHPQAPSGEQYVCLPDESLLGLYVSPQFPPRYTEQEEDLNNTNGLAWWSGTSFAAGVMSGILALFASRGIQLDTTGGFNSIGFLLGLETLFQQTTQKGEPIFRVKQIIE
jgi:subtilisin family serine protease